MSAPRQHSPCLDCCLSFFFPPIAILVHAGECNAHYWINVCLCIWTLGIGGIIHAYWFCFCRPDDTAPIGGAGPNININLNNQTNMNAGGANPVPMAPVYAAPPQQVVYAAAPPPQAQPIYMQNPGQPVYAPAPPNYDGYKN